MTKFSYALAGLMALFAASSNGAHAAGEMPLSAMATRTHFHGLSVDASDPSRLYLATHHGLFSVDSRGIARKVSNTSDDFMGFTAHPSDPTVLYASGHPAAGGNLGFIASQDRGVSWTRLSPGIGGPVDFHQMDVSKADPKVIYGVHGNLQRSADGGKTWTAAGPVPDGLIAIAASSRSSDTVYAATQTGLLRSTDGGKQWSAIHSLQRPASMVHVARDGTIYAFLLGTGLIKATESNLDWKTITSGFGQRYVLHLAVDPTNQRKLYAITTDATTHAQAVLASTDAGSSWASYGSQQ